MRAFLKNTLGTPLGILITVFVLAVVVTIPTLIVGEQTMSLIGLGIQLLATVVCFVVIPLALIKFVFKEDVRDYGWQLPARETKPVARTLIILIPLIGIAWTAAYLPEFRTFYSREESGGLMFWVIAIIAPAFYYLCEEFFYRGFLLQPLWKKWRYVGVALSIGLFTFLHLGKPAIELVFAALIGVLLSMLALNTKSFVPAAIVHWSIAIVLNVVVALH